MSLVCVVRRGLAGGPCCPLHDTSRHCEGQIVSAGSAKPALGALKQSLDSWLSENASTNGPFHSVSQGRAGRATTERPQVMTTVDERLLQCPEGRLRAPRQNFGSIAEKPMRERRISATFRHREPCTDFVRDCWKKPTVIANEPEFRDRMKQSHEIGRLLRSTPKRQVPAEKPVEKRPISEGF